MIIGIIKRAKDIGYVGYNCFIWHSCEMCGKERWVKYKKGKPDNRRCISCNRKGKPHPWNKKSGQDAMGWKGGRIRDDNRIENLQLVSELQHRSITIVEQRLKYLENRIIQLEAELLLLKSHIETKEGVV